MPHYTALLARATWAAGDKPEALRLYREAAGRGDLRALVSLGLITENGDGVPRNPAAAAALYERAAAGGFPDGAINLAVMLDKGKGVEPRQEARRRAARRARPTRGRRSPPSTSASLALNGTAGTVTEAFDHFSQAASLGGRRGYQAAALLVDKGGGPSRRSRRRRRPLPARRRFRQRRGIRPAHGRGRACHGRDHPGHAGAPRGRGLLRGAGRRRERPPLPGRPHRMAEGRPSSAHELIGRLRHECRGGAAAEI